MKKIVITGATGLIGKAICKKLIDRRDEVTVFSRDINNAKKEIPGAKEYFEWDYHYPGDWQHILNNKDAVIHLAGANLSSKRWDEDYKKVILESREISTKNLVKSIESQPSKPLVFICSSAIHYYGNSGDKELTEDSPSGNDFLANVCKKWEEEAAKVEKFHVRRASVRTGVVLSLEEGALNKMLPAFKFYVGGPIGSGKQWFAWIHLDDLVNIFIRILDFKELSGPINAVSPRPERMKDFAKTLGKILNRPSFFRVPQFVLKIVLGEMANSITYSLKVIPKKLLDSNFVFKYEDLESALKDIIK